MTGPTSDPVLVVAQALHFLSDHYRDFRGPLAPDKDSSFLCNCREKAVIAVYALEVAGFMLPLL
jgi:hypothetical protein